MWFSTLLLIFILIKIILYFFPELLHKKRNNAFRKRFFPNKGFIIAAHRGGSFEGLENSLKNYKRCVESGVKLLEGDIQMTKDRRLVMIHDSNLRRLTGKDLEIGDLLFEELPNYQETIRVHFSKQQYYTNPDNLGQRPELLEKYFKAFKGQDVYMCLELKSGRIEEVRMVHEMLNRLKMHDQVSFGVAHTSLAEARREVGQFTSFFDKANIMKLVVRFFCGREPEATNSRAFGIHLV